jgi:hypothetical protein
VTLLARCDWRDPVAAIGAMSRPSGPGVLRAGGCASSSNERTPVACVYQLRLCAGIAFFSSREAPMVTVTPVESLRQLSAGH